MGPVSSGEDWVAEVSDYLQHHQRVHKRLCNRPRGTLPSIYLELILKAPDERFPGFLVGDEV
jgi:hypothetical protein